MSAALHSDVASAIGQQVEQMILQAKKDSESRVKHDLSVARTQLTHMDGLIGELTERVARSARANRPGAPDPSQNVDRAFMNQKIAQLEQKWESEVKALKQDLHRTILAHNHNSDLMRHHRDALDEARRKLDSQTQPKAEQVDAQIEKVDRMLRQGQAKQRAIDQLTERLTSLEAQVGEMLPGPMPGFMMPGMPGMPGMMGQPPGILEGGRVAAGAAGAAGAGKTKWSSKDGEGPTDQELRARLLQAARGGKSDDVGSIAFNAEAPIFVPCGAPAEAGPAKEGKSKSRSSGPAVITEKPNGKKKVVETVSEEDDGAGEDEPTTITLEEAASIIKEAAAAVETEKTEEEVEAANEA